MRELIEQVLGSLLDRLGSGWKSTIGIAAILAIKLADQLDYISPETAADWYGWAVLIFGVGVIHKQLRAKKQLKNAEDSSQRAMNLALWGEEHKDAPK